MLVMGNRRIHTSLLMLKGLAHEHGSEGLLEDIQELGYDDVILKCHGGAHEVGHSWCVRE